MKPEYLISIILVVLVLAGGAYLLTRTPEGGSGTLGEGQSYVEIVNPSGFVNTEGITIGQFVGEKVVLVDFMTYSCINCQRTFPYVTAWYETYKDDGLVIVGIHTPEFAFEKDIDNVREALQRFGITYPVVLDNEYATWNAYGNRYWPRKYLIDIHGNIVYDHIGEGAYEETEAKIRELLEERAQVLGEETTLDSMAAVGEAEESEALSPETYFGATRNEFLGNGIRNRQGTQTLVLPQEAELNTLYLGGTWNIQDEYAESVSAGIVRYRYAAKNVYLVAESDTPVEIEVWQDGKRVSNMEGTDITAGVVTIGESRLYTLIRNVQSGEHVLELRIKGSGVRIYTFTFG